MIPLIRPLVHVPAIEDLDTSQITNFGKNFDAVVKRLHSITGRYVLPVTNGTVAITIAKWTLEAMKKKKYTSFAVPSFTVPATAQALSCNSKEISVKSCGMATLSFEYVPNEDLDVVVSPLGYYVDTKPYHYRDTIFDLAANFMHFPQTTHPVTYSLHATKNLNCYEGGLVSFATEEEFKVALRLTNFNLDQHRNYSFVGTNAKLDELRCAVLLHWLNDLPAIIRRIDAHKHIANEYASCLQRFCVHPLNNHPLSTPPLAMLYCLDTEFLDRLVLRGNEAGIVFRRYYHKQLAPVSPALDGFIAFPSDVSDEEFKKVVNFVRFL